ncbi:MAG: hypothetical protein M9962_02525 [Oligoflexia bacterium]|nr:hypothetical protein [Oligoflexia bacterium]
MKTLIGLLAALFLSPLSFANSKLTSDLYINGEKTSTIDPAEAAEWKFQFHDTITEEKVTDFRPWHTRDMHLLLIKKDYSTFTHVHADLIGKTGIFTTILNQQSHDPDNQQAIDAITSPGEYFVLSEVSPLDRQRYSITEIVRETVTAKGQEEYKDFKIDSSEQSTSEHDHPPHHNPGSIRIEKFFAVKGMPDLDRPWRTPEKFSIEPGIYGDMYRVELTSKSTKGCGGNLIQFFLKTSKWDSSKAAYTDLTELDSWLGMVGGHAIFLEYSPEKSLADLDFAHLHGMQHDGHPMMEFVHFDRSIMNGKKYRAWFQLKTMGKIHTFPFSFMWKDSYKTQENCR